MSTYGKWIDDHGVPAFSYGADHTAIDAAEWDPRTAPLTRRHFVALGNRRIQAVVDNEGGTALWDTAHALRWLTAPDPAGTGTSTIVEADGTTWGSAFADRPQGESTPKRIFGPTYFDVKARRSGLSLFRSILCPEGEAPWVLVRVVLHLDEAAAAPRAITHRETWRVAPRFVQLGTNPESRREIANAAVTYEVTTGPGSARAAEVRTEKAAHYENARNPTVFGPPIPLRLDAVGPTLLASFR
ncbi:MAG: cellobiose phosphorylase, partial [Actinomycetota bacterium]